MKNPESLNRSEIFRALGKHLCDRWGLGLQLVNNGTVSRPIVVSGTSALSIFMQASSSRLELRAEHEKTLCDLSISREAEILEHPAGFQILVFPCKLASGTAGLVLGPMALAEELNDRRKKVQDYLASGGIPKQAARSASEALRGLDRRDIEYVSSIAELLSAETVRWAEQQLETERRLDNLRKKNRTRYSSIIGNSISMQEMFSMLDRIVQTDSTVYLHGENGTGKELVAQAIHRHSLRHEAPFVAQNCSALNDNLLESEIFGHKRGAFTGAVNDKIGLFEEADGGTFFLDEIGDMSPALQVKLLRVLQEGTFLPVGDVTPRKVDVRIICATNRDLAQLVKSGQFREDLYYRINVIRLVVPPLRERRDDIPLLVDYFMARSSVKESNSPKDWPGQKKLSKGAIERLTEHDWPGNVRELENEIERMNAMAGALVTTLGEELLSPRIRHRPLKLLRSGLSNMSLPDALEQLERKMIHETLRQNRWNKTKTAAALGISRRNLIRKVEKYGFDRRSR